ncbi:MAG TPA: hypothetical protein VMB91_13840 [Solirubrobacteraceae bacterium]|nr:hypothetical protein [Solirubrobacteraceae bacterium]
MTSHPTYTELLRRELVGASRRLHAADGPSTVTGPAGAHGRRPALRRRGLLPLAGVLGLAAVTAAVVVLMSAGGGPPAAYAVTQNPDGTVTLSLDEVLGLEPVNERLAQLGVPVVVAKMEAGCDEHGEHVLPSEAAPMFPEMIRTAKAGTGLAGITWVIRPSLIPSGDTLRIAVQRDPNSPIPAVGAQFGLFRGQAPRCALPGTFDG